VSRVLLARSWDGEYLALFRAPDGIGPGMALSASLREWIAARLGGTLDAAAVRAFQASHGIAADGVPGPETMMALAADVDGPRLLRAFE